LRLALSCWLCREYFGAGASGSRLGKRLTCEWLLWPRRLMLLHPQFDIKLWWFCIIWAMDIGWIRLCFYKSTQRVWIAIDEKKHDWKIDVWGAEIPYLNFKLSFFLTQVWFFTFELISVVYAWHFWLHSMCYFQYLIIKLYSLSHTEVSFNKWLIRLWNH
jgi:hypothetical protein